MVSSGSVSLINGAPETRGVRAHKGVLETHPKLMINRTTLPRNPILEVPQCPPGPPSDGDHLKHAWNRYCINLYLRFGRSVFFQDKPSSGQGRTGGTGTPGPLLMVLDPSLKKCSRRSFQKVPNYMGMVLVKHDSTCRPRGSESVVFVLV